MAQPPLVFLAGRIIRRFDGCVTIGLTSIVAAINGVLVPLGIAKLFGQLGKTSPEQTVKWLVIALAIAGILESINRRALDRVLCHARERLSDYIAEKLRYSPTAVQASTSSQMMINQFYSALDHTVWILTDHFPMLTVGLGGFILVLVFHGVPWWVYLVLGAMLTVAIGAYWPLKNSTRHKQAAELRSQEVEHLAVIYDARSNRQVQPALKQAQRKVSAETREAQTLANRQSHLYTDSRAGINTVLRITAVVAAPFVSGETAVLLVVFVFSFSGHLSSIHYTAEFLQKVNVNGAELLKVISAPSKPPICPDLTLACLETKELQVVYPGVSGGPKTVVQIGDISIGPHQLAVFTGENGCGKTTLFRITGGDITGYGGAVQMWGRSAAEFDLSGSTAAFSQDRLKLPARVGDLFADDQGYVNRGIQESLMRQLAIPHRFLNKRHDELSGGQRQKLDLALVLYWALVDPGVRLVKIDEPTNNLDHGSVRRLPSVFEWFWGSFKDKGALLLATHDPVLQPALLGSPDTVEAIWAA